MREITHKHNCLVIIFHIETFPEAILIFIKQKKKASKGYFPDYTLPTFKTYKLLIIFTTFKTCDKTCSKILKAWFLLLQWVAKCSKMNGKMMFILIYLSNN